MLSQGLAIIPVYVGVEILPAFFFLNATYVAYCIEEHRYNSHLNGSNWHVFLIQFWYKE